MVVTAAYTCAQARCWTFLKLLSMSVIPRGVLTIALGITPVLAAASVDLTVKETAGVGADGFPTTVVIPLPEGQHQTTSGFSLGVPAQFEVIERWANKDNSIRHVAAHFQATVPSQGQSVYTFRTDAVNPSPPHPVAVSESANVITVTTGPIRFKMDKSSFSILDSVWHDLDQSGTYSDSERIILSSPNHGGRFDGCSISGGVCNQELQHDTGLTPDVVTIEEAGPMRAVIRVERHTDYSGSTNHKHGYVVRVYAYAGKPWIKIDYQLVNAATGPSLNGGKWAGPLYFNSLELDWELQLLGPATVKSSVGDGTIYTADPVGSGGLQQAITLHDTWATRHANGSGSLASCADAATDATNDCADALWVDVSDGTWGVQAIVRNGWEMWPNGLEIADNTSTPVLSVQLWPDWSGQYYNGTQKTVYWLDDMQAVYKEVLLNFHGATPSDTTLTAIAETFDRYPVPTLPASYYASTGVTLDLDGLQPVSADVPETLLESYASSEMDETNNNYYHMGWTRWYSDEMYRLVDSQEAGVGPVGAEEFVASGSPVDFWETQMWTIGELNNRPQWFGSDYTHAGDYAAIQLDDSPYARTVKSAFHWRDDYSDNAGYGTYSISGTGPYAEARDSLHHWFYHTASYWYDYNLWVKDWLTWMGEYRRRWFLADDGTYIDRAVGHVVWGQWQSYRVTGDTSLLDEIADYVAEVLAPDLSPLCGRSDTGGVSSSSSLEKAYVTRGLASTLQSFKGYDWQRWADVFNYVSAYMEWDYFYGAYAYHPHDPASHPGSFQCDYPNSSSATAWNTPDSVAWYYWFTGKSRFKTQNDTYVNTGINGGNRPYTTPTPSGRVFVHDSGANGYSDDSWDGRYAGRAYFYVGDAVRSDFTPPAQIEDLHATLSGTVLSLAWTPPVDASYYLVVWSDKIVEECTSGCTTDPQSTDTSQYRNWWVAEPFGCDASGCNGGAATITDVDCDPCYAAVFAFDGADNMSSISNVALSTSVAIDPPVPPDGFQVN